MTVRIERDSMGEVEVPADACWGAQTQRAIENFTISGMRLAPKLIGAIARIKAAAAATNAELGVISPAMAEAIETAADEVVEGRWAEQFPVDVFQTGSGTSSNMNVNEVLAHLASRHNGQPVHPNDHVNASQSSNDVFPSAIHIAAAAAIADDLLPALGRLAGALTHQAVRLAHVVKAGRTHLMDATPVTLGQEFGGWAAAISHGCERLRSCLPRVCELPLGGTAVGTGINAPARFAPAAIARLAASTGLPLVEAPDHFEAQAGREALVEASGQLRTVAVSLIRITNDLRWMASGPQAGLGEIRLPDLQPGSSIMPGKVNPVVPEAVWQVAVQVIGNDTAVAYAATAGAFELSLGLPVLARNLLESIALLTSASALLSDCVLGVEADEERCRRYAESSPALATALNPYLGYETSAAIVHQALTEGRTVREVVVERGLMTAEEAAYVLDVEAMTRGGIRTPRPLETDPTDRFST